MEAQNGVLNVREKNEHSGAFSVFSRDGRPARCPRRCLVLVRVVVDERLGEVPVKKRIKEREKKNQNIMAKTSCRYLHVWH